MKNLMSEKTKQQPIENVFLKLGEECVGFYRELRTEFGRIIIILQLNNGKRVGISLPSGLNEETIRKEFFSVKKGDLVGLLRIRLTKTPILIRKLRDNKNETNQNFEDKKQTTQR
jgi:hypothetical protein